MVYCTYYAKDDLYYIDQRQPIMAAIFCRVRIPAFFVLVKYAGTVSQAERVKSVCGSDK